MIGDYLEQYTFEYLINSALEYVPESLDKREGSIIYDALAPACYELAEYYMRLRRLLNDTYAETAAGKYLDRRVIEQGLVRYPATVATRKGIFVNVADEPAIIPLGARFSTVDDEGSVNYTVIEIYIDEDGEPVPGSYKLRCETAGVIGNDYAGPLIPITNIVNLKSATLGGVIIPARDAETDEELRARFFVKVVDKPFGGNIADYTRMLKEIDGVGGVQVYPTFSGGGTVLCSVVDAQYNSISENFREILQELIYPVDGEGLGMAPIGHQVTITGPEEVAIDIEMTVTLSSGIVKSQVEQPIKDVIETYLLQLRKEWDTSDDLNVYSLFIYIARLSAVILSVPGVDNVASVTVNGLSDDFELLQGPTVQQIPVMGAVVINE